MSDDAVDYSGTIILRLVIYNMACHSIAQLIMSDLQTSITMGASGDILQMIVCLRDGKEAVEHLKERYPEEANNGRRAGHQD